jgi:hypothetical protein
VSPVKYELSSYIPENDILLSHRRETLRPYIDMRRCNPMCLFPVCTYYVEFLQKLQSSRPQPILVFFC